MKGVLLGVLTAMLVFQSEPGRLEVVVRDASSGESLVGVTVNLTLRESRLPVKPSFSAVTDRTGLVSFLALEPGEYALTLESYRPLKTIEHLWIESGERPHLDISVYRVANVTVRVLDAAGNPIKDALVQLPAIRYADGRRTLQEVEGVKHDKGSNGVFRILNVPPGDYYLQIKQPESSLKANADFPLLTYFPGVQDFSNATPISLRGEDLDLGDVRLPVQKLFKVSGTIARPAGQRISLVGLPVDTLLQLYVVLNEGASPDDPVLLRNVRYRRGANPNESVFEIDGLPAGRHSLYSMFLSDSTDITSKTTFIVADQDVTGLQISMGQRVSITGRVRFDGERIPSGIQVGIFARDPMPVEASTVDYPLSSVSLSGEFTLNRLSEGIRYGLSITGLPANSYVHDVRLGASSLLNEGSFVATTRPQRLELEVRTQGATIMGVVRDAFNRPIEKATIVLVPEWARRGNSMLYKRGTAGADGRFAIQGISPGDYQMFAWRAAPPAGAEQDSEFLTRFTGKGTWVRANVDAVSDVVLRPADE